MQMTSRNSRQEIDWLSLLNSRRKSLLAMERSIERQAIHELSPTDTGEISKIKTHPADLGSETRQIEVLSHRADFKIRQLQAVDEAIQRLKKGTFGQCLNCDRSIDVERLRVIPEARYCIDCEKDFESMTPQERQGPPMELYETKELKALKVSDVMTEQPLTVRLNENVETAWDLMENHNIRHLPVLDDRGDVQGVLSDRDLQRFERAFRRRQYEGVLENSFGELKIKQVMTKVPETIPPDMSLVDAGTILIENKISCLPVVEADHLVGMLTETDFVKVVLAKSQSI